VNTKALREAIAKSQLSVAELSKETGLGTARLYELVDQNRPEQNITIETLRRIAVVLGRNLGIDPTALYLSFFEHDVKLRDKRLKKSKS
jgi:transcriptional regulator with XRE-family HTH domain